MVDEPVEDVPHRPHGKRSLLLGLRPEVHALEHERAQVEHRPADVLALDDVVGVGRGLDDVVHERVDPARAALAEERDLLLRQLLGPEQPRPQRVVDVVVDVRDAVDEADDLALERLGLVGPRVVEDPVARLGREVEPAPVALQELDDAQRLLVVAEAAPKRSESTSSSASSPVWPNGACPRSWPSAIASARSSFNAQRPGDRAGDPGGTSSVCVSRVR